MSDEVVGEQEEPDSSDGEEAAGETDPPSSTRRLVTVAVPPVDRLLVILGACAMVLSGLLSWIEAAPDAFPNFAGVGAGGGGVGLVVMLIGLALLSGRPQLDTANGVALGAFLASLVTVITLTGDSAVVGMGAGAWVAMVGSLVALTGVTFGMVELNRRPQRQITHKAAGTLGAGLALIASFWLDWVVLNLGHFAYSAVETLEGPSAAPSAIPRVLVAGGLDDGVATGYPVLILSVLVLLLLLGLLSATASPKLQASMAMHIRVAGIAIVALAAGDLLGSLLGFGPTGSGPILALIGGLMITRSVGSAEGANSETAVAEPA